MAIDTTLFTTLQNTGLIEHPKTTAARPQANEQATVNRFEALLASLEKSEGIGKAAATTAEIMQLEMMRNALTLDPAASFQPLTSSALPIELILSESRQNTAPPAIPSSEEPVTSVPTPITRSSSNSEGPPPHLDSIISTASRKYGVDSALIKAVIRVESNFNPTAVSHAGAQGLMQLMPSTARGLGVNNSFDPVQNVMGGTRFLKDMLERYGGNIDKALAAYNWGPGNVDKGTRTMPKETRDYLVKVKQLYNEYAT